MKTPAETWLDLDRLRSTGARPHYFGLGFIQLKVENGHAVVSNEDVALEPMAGTVRAIVAR